jgi:hypothetical protein
MINKVMKKGELANRSIIATVIAREKVSSPIGWAWGAVYLAGLSSPSMVCSSSIRRPFWKRLRKREKVQDQYTDGLITDGERYNKVMTFGLR